MFGLSSENRQGWFCVSFSLILVEVFLWERNHRAFWVRFRGLLRGLESVQRSVKDGGGVCDLAEVKWASD